VTGTTDLSCFLAGVVQVSRYRVDTEHQLSSTDRWEDRDCKQVGGRISEELCGGATTSMD
jgi:hypothetical protein